MMNNHFTIGVTGHRKLPEKQIPNIEQSIKDFFIEKQNIYGSSNITVLSSLAEGVDMLCARLAVDMGLRLVVALPINTMEYRKDFSGTVVIEYDFLLSMADEIFTVIPEEPVPVNLSRGFYYRQAGIYVVKIAIFFWLFGIAWNEIPLMARGRGKR